MNASQVRALAADAFHQVLDNGVFRVLAVLCALPVLFTFLVGFREEGVVVLFGMKSWSYLELVGLFGEKVLPPDPRGLVIEVVLQLVLQFLAGSLGMLVALSATSFFVPRLLEKGSAELYFHKPVSRTVLFLSRYFAGLLFVGLVSFLLVAGMYLGLLLVSGHGDAGILLAALTLTYSFAPIYAFTLLCGVVTRSTVASLLLSSFFFLFNGCVHKGWIQWQQAREGPSFDVLRVERETQEASGDAAQGSPSSAAESPAPEANDAGEDDDQGDDDEPGTAAMLLRVLDVAHLVLPKTTDADYLGRKLRAALDAPLFRDESSYVTLARLPEGLEPLELGTLESEPLRALLGEPRLAAEDGSERHSLWSRPALESVTRFGTRERRRLETASQAAKALAKELEGRPGVNALVLESRSESLGRSSRGQDVSAWRVSWLAGAGAEARTQAALTFKGLDDDEIFTLLVDGQGELAPEAAETARQRLGGELYLDHAAANDWYMERLAFDAPLRFNIWFSLGSTLAFLVLVLALGAWRLGRIEF